MVLPHLIFKRSHRLAILMLYVHHLRESNSLPISVGNAWRVWIDEAGAQEAWAGKFCFSFLIPLHSRVWSLSTHKQTDSSAFRPFSVLVTEPSDGGRKSVGSSREILDGCTGHPSCQLSWTFISSVLTSILLLSEVRFRPLVCALGHKAGSLAVTPRQAPCCTFPLPSPWETWGFGLSLLLVSSAQELHLHANQFPLSVSPWWADLGMYGNLSAVKLLGCLEIHQWEKYLKGSSSKL